MPHPQASTGEKSQQESGAEAAGPSEILVKQLRTRRTGLTEDEAGDRLLQYGPNVLTRRARKHWWRSATSQFTHPLAVLLELAAVLAFVSGSSVLGWTILAVVVLNALFALFQEHQAERSVEALQSYVPRQCTVVRSGTACTLDASRLVPGDVLVVSEGQRVSADARILSGEVEVDLSTLTGESVPVLRTSAPAARAVPHLEASDLVFSGTSCTMGTCRALVFATGDHTELGRIASLAQTADVQQSPLEQQVKRVARLIAFVALAAGLAFLPLGLAAGLSFTAAFLFAIGLLVANVPEGLLPTITLALAMGVRELASQGAVVKRLSAVQTLGATTVVCTDKTGTLTENKMTPVAVHLVEPGCPDVLAQPEVARRSAVRALAAAMRSCAVTTEGGAATDPTELAMLEAAHTIEPLGPVAVPTRVHIYPFRASEMMSSTIDRTRSNDSAGARLVLSAKGAPEAVMGRCSTALREGRLQPLEGEVLEEVTNTLNALTEQGLRVLAVASRPLPDDRVPVERAGAEHELCLLGLVALLDPPRPEVAPAVRSCHEAGMRVVVITGDNALTAAEVARQVGIGEVGRRVVHGTEVDAMSDEALGALLRAPGEVICSRSSPENKMRLASVLQSQGEVVAMTGDGVNDAPALRRADIGVAMGRSGTDVAREAATMVLTDDNLATIVTAVREGRRIYDNVRKFILYIFAHAVPEVVPFLVFALSGGRVPLPLTVLQILAIDLGTETVPALALGREPVEPGIMTQPPRSQREHLVTGRMLGRAWGVLGISSAVLCMTAFFTTLLLGGWTWGAPTGPGTVLHHAYLQATTATFVGIVACQVGAAFAARTDRVSLFRVGILTNRLLLAGIAFEVLFTAALVYLPAMNDLLRTAPLPWHTIAMIAVFPLVVWGLDEAYRARLRREVG